MNTLHQKGDDDEKESRGVESATTVERNRASFHDAVEPPERTRGGPSRNRSLGGPNADHTYSVTKSQHDDFHAIDIFRKFPIYDSFGKHQKSPQRATPHKLSNSNEISPDMVNSRS
jgi:hypothetical protein